MSVDKDRAIPEGGIEVGQGAVFGIGSDRYPYTIVKIVNDKKVVVQADHYRRTDNNGQSTSQTYEFTPNPQACEITVTRRTDGSWRKQGEAKGGVFSFHGRHAYLDPSF